MTKHTHYKNILRSPLIKVAYRTFIIFYSLHMIFSSNAFALQVEAPVGQISFVEIDGPDPLFREDLVIDERVEKIKSFYERYNLPLAAHAEDFVASADRYGIDWRLVAAIGMIESTGGKFACKTASYSAFGWGSCKINFSSYTESIDVISKNLAGENPNTAYHYAGKDIRGILESYNPPSVVPNYANKVMKQMKIIENQ